MSEKNSRNKRNNFYLFYPILWLGFFAGLTLNANPLSKDGLSWREYMMLPLMTKSIDQPAVAIRRKETAYPQNADMARLKSEIDKFWVVHYGKDWRDNYLDSFSLTGHEGLSLDIGIIMDDHTYIQDQGANKKSVVVARYTWQLSKPKQAKKENRGSEWPLVSQVNLPSCTVMDHKSLVARDFNMVPFDDIEVVFGKEKPKWIQRLRDIVYSDRSADPCQKAIAIHFLRDSDSNLDSIKRQFLRQALLQNLADGNFPYDYSRELYGLVLGAPKTTDFRYYRERQLDLWTKLLEKIDNEIVSGTFKEVPLFQELGFLIESFEIDHPEKSQKIVEDAKMALKSYVQRLGFEKNNIVDRWPLTPVVKSAIDIKLGVESPVFSNQLWEEENTVISEKNSQNIQYSWEPKVLCELSAGATSWVNCSDPRISWRGQEEYLNAKLAEASITAKKPREEKVDTGYYPARVTDDICTRFNDEIGLYEDFACRTSVIDVDEKRTLDFKSLESGESHLAQSPIFNENDFEDVIESPEEIAEAVKDPDHIEQKMARCFCFAREIGSHGEGSGFQFMGQTWTYSLVESTLTRKARYSCLQLAQKDLGASDVEVASLSCEIQSHKMPRELGEKAREAVERAYEINQQYYEQAVLDPKSCPMTFKQHLKTLVTAVVWGVSGRIRGSSKVGGSLPGGATAGGYAIPWLVWMPMFHDVPYSQATTLYGSNILTGKITGWSSAIDMGQSRKHDPSDPRHNPGNINQDTIQQSMHGWRTFSGPMAYMKYKYKELDFFAKWIGPLFGGSYRLGQELQNGGHIPGRYSEEDLTLKNFFLGNQLTVGETLGFAFWGLGVARTIEKARACEVREVDPLTIYSEN